MLWIAIIGLVRATPNVNQPKLQPVPIYPAPGTARPRPSPVVAGACMRRTCVAVHHARAPVWVRLHQADRVLKRLAPRLRWVLTAGVGGRYLVIWRVAWPGRRGGPAACALRLQHGEGAAGPWCVVF